MIRMIHTPKGKLNALLQFPKPTIKLAIQYASGNLSIANLEDLGSDLFGMDISIVEVADPLMLLS